MENSMESAQVHSSDTDHNSSQVPGKKRL